MYAQQSHALATKVSGNTRKPPRSRSPTAEAADSSRNKNATRPKPRTVQATITRQSTTPARHSVLATNDSGGARIQNIPKPYQHHITPYQNITTPYQPYQNNTQTITKPYQHHTNNIPKHTKTYQTPVATLCLTERAFSLRLNIWSGICVSVLPKRWQNGPCPKLQNYYNKPRQRQHAERIIRIYGRIDTKVMTQSQANTVSDAQTLIANSLSKHCQTTLPNTLPNNIAKTLPTHCPTLNAQNTVGQHDANSLPTPL